MGSDMDYRTSHSVQVSLPNILEPLSFGLPANYAQHNISAANENLVLKSEWMTPAEALQTITRIKNKLMAENARDFVLFHSAKRRKTWDEIVACEQCLRWTYFRK